MLRRCRCSSIMAALSPAARWTAENGWLAVITRMRCWFGRITIPDEAISCVESGWASCMTLRTLRFPGSRRWLGPSPPPAGRGHSGKSFAGFPSLVVVKRPAGDLAHDAELAPLHLLDLSHMLQNDGRLAFSWPIYIGIYIGQKKRGEYCLSASTISK